MEQFVWDEMNLKKNLYVLKLKNRQNIKYDVGSGIFMGTSKIIGASSDGSIHLWDYKKPFRPKIIFNAHPKGFMINSLICDEPMFYSKSLAGEIKKWDLRNLKSPVSEIVFKNENQFSKLSLFPNQNLIGAIKTLNDRDSTSELIYLNKDTLKITNSIKLSFMAVGLNFNSRLNQLAISSNKRDIKFYCEPETALKGALLISNENEYVMSDEEFSPVQDKKLLREARQNAKELLYKGRKSEMPKINKDEARTIAKSSFASGMLRKMSCTNLMRDQDPRATLLSYQQKANENPLFENKKKKTKKRVN